MTGALGLWGPVDGLRGRGLEAFTAESPGPPRLTQGGYTMERFWFLEDEEKRPNTCPSCGRPIADFKFVCEDCYEQEVEEASVPDW